MAIKVLTDRFPDRLVEQRGDDWFIDGKRQAVDFVQTGVGKFHVLKGGKSYHIQLRPSTFPESYQVEVNGEPFLLHIKTPLSTLLEQMGMNKPEEKKIKLLKAPMPGLILKIMAKPGTLVHEGDPLFILEAMKMENIVKASTEGLVKAIYVTMGQNVEKNQPLILFE